MSADFDFWEFVCCARCQLPANTENGPTLPFWLTECGHVICNNHLKSDQSCAKCGAQQIQVTPLQQDLEAPMSAWFSSAPPALDQIAFAVKFQQDSMASQIRFYKAKYHRQKILSDQLKRANETLAAENAQLRQGYEWSEQLQYEEEEAPAQFVNTNGKRPMAGNHSRHHDRPGSRASSSTHSSGPERLTIPSTQHPPPLRHDERAPPTAQGVDPSHRQEQFERPGTGRFQERFSYNEPQAPMRPQPLSHTQAAPRALQQKLQHQIPADRSMPPPPVPNSSKTSIRHQNPQNIPPPPTPQRAGSNGFNPSSHNPLVPSTTRTSKRPSNKFLQPAARTSSEGHFTAPPTPAGGSHRFVPPVSNAQQQQQQQSAGPSIPFATQRKAFIPRSGRGPHG